MAVIVQLIGEYSNYIYAACGLVALWLLRTAILARRERTRAVFSLEREAAMNRTYSTFRLAIALLLIMGIVYAISNYLVIAVEPIIAQADPTPTPAFLINTPTPTALPASPTPTITITPTETPRPRATPRPTPTLPAETPTPAIAMPNCPDGRAIILEPGVGQTITGPVQVIGSSQSENFSYYKIEFKPANAAGDFGFYLRREAPVQNGPLGVWDPGGLPAGDYLLRLVTVDITGNYGDCTVRVVVGG